MDAAAYLAQLQALLPPGAAWPREPGAVLTRVLTPVAGELARVDARAADLRREADPRTTLELLPEWEAECGLPDCCGGVADTLEARRARVVQQLLARGGQSRAYFLALAAALGFTVTITEFNHYVCELDCEQPVYDEPWRFVWRVDAAAVTVHELTAETVCEAPLAWWGNQVLECVIRRRKPAHTHVLFGYGG